MRLVLDASAAVNALVPSELRAATRRQLEGADVCAPTLIDTDVLSALALLERGGAISSIEADHAVAAWQRFPVTRFPGDAMLGEIWSLRHSVRISDAHYVALARALAAPLLTADRRLTRAPVRDLSVLVVG